MDGDWDRMGALILVPHARASVIRQKFNDDMDQKKQAGQYYPIQPIWQLEGPVRETLQRWRDQCRATGYRKYLHIIKGATVISPLCTCACVIIDA